MLHPGQIIALPPEGAGSAWASSSRTTCRRTRLKPVCDKRYLRLVLEIRTDILVNQANSSM